MVLNSVKNLPQPRLLALSREMPFYIKANYKDQKLSGTGPGPNRTGPKMGFKSPKGGKKC